MRWGVLTLVLVSATSAWAQNVKETCADSSERGQKLADDRRLLEARTAFLSCAQESCPPAVRRDCQTQLDDLKKNVPSIVVRVKAKDGSDVAQGAVSLDGAKIGVLDGKVVDLDPGTHRVHVDLPDGRTFDQQVIVAAGERNRIVTFGEPAAGPTSEQPAPPVTHWSTVRTIGLISVVAGGTSMLLGIGTQVLALVSHSNATTLQERANSESPNSCISIVGVSANADCNSAISYQSQAVTAQTIAIGTFIGGGVVLIAGIVMYIAGGNVTAPPQALRITPVIDAHTAGLGLSGTF